MINDFTKARATNSTGDTPAVPIPTTTEPTGDGVFDVPLGTDRLLASFFGVGANGATFTARLIAWSKAGTLWIPRVAIVYSATLNAVTGVAGSTVLNSERFSGPAGEVEYSPAYVQGAVKMQWTFALGTATAANALFRWER